MIDELLQTHLACPSCLSSLNWAAAEGVCSGCGHRFEVVNGIPIMTMTGAADESAETAHRLQQANYFDTLDERFEITRPHSTPALHSWLLAQKFRFAMAALPVPVPSAVALTVCGGSGMDAEYLCRHGYATISSDISLQAAERAVKRGKIFGVPIRAIVCDATRLPFRSESLDLVLVHDGLHHLVEPQLGILEMVRVSRQAISVNEPADATFTKIAVKLGLSTDLEEAGNRVARLNLLNTKHQIEEHGFTVLSAQRYAMFYKHAPGFVTRMLSLTGVFELSIAGWRFANAVIGSAGNKLSITAVRGNQ
jgi:ubiquinone/menaquinone biosynthesis C-methylase UbiE